MRREDLQHQRKAKCLPDLRIPVSCEVRVLSIEDRDKAQEGSVQELEVDQQDDYADVDKLDYRDLGELTHCFFVDRVSFFDEDNVVKDRADYNVDDYNDHGCANYKALLKDVVLSPATAIEGGVRDAVQLVF